MSFSTLHDLLPRHFHATNAVRLTRERKKAIHEKSLAKAAVPHVKRMIEEIEQAAAHGYGRCDYILEMTSDTDTKMLEFACDYLRMEGYKVETSEDSTSAVKNIKVVVIRWLD
ncbi:hypothetical protein ACHY48_16155 [Pantoea agglomerans]|uniref:hypothetical protein n=1 Tax=Enterobacter agglomerans TaxID=549 RepID=UPI002028EDE1